MLKNKYIQIYNKVKSFFFGQVICQSSSREGNYQPLNYKNPVTFQEFIKECLSFSDTCNI